MFVPVGFMGEFVAAAVFFLALAWTQLLWGVVFAFRPGVGLARLGIIGNVLVVALWIVTRTVGIPISPDPWTPEPLGLSDLIASGLELALIMSLALALRRSRRNGHSLENVRVSADTLLLPSLVVAMLSAVALLAGPIQ